MRVLFLSAWFPHPPDNGSKLRVYHLLRALGQAHEVSLLSFAFATARPEDAVALVQCCGQADVVELDPFAANRAGTLRTFASLSPMASRPIPTMSQRVVRVLAAKSFDAVIASTEMMADYALQTPPGVARILEEHNSMARWMKGRYLEQTHPLQRARCWVSWQKTRHYEARLFEHFDLVTMVSDQDQADSHTLPGYRGRVEVVPNGVDCAHNRPSLAQPRPAALVFNGGLTYSANYDAMRWFLAEVYPRIRTQVPEVTLAITGSTESVNLAGLALDDSVHLTGFVQDVRLPVAGAAVAVAPIRQGGGTRLKILEAMALGTPVVATTKGAEGLEVVAGEHLLLADTPAAFAQATLALLGDADLRARLTVAARRLVEERYDWAQIGRQFVGLVGETVARRRAEGRGEARG